MYLDKSKYIVTNNQLIVLIQNNFYHITPVYVLFETKSKEKNNV